MNRSKTCSQWWETRLKLQKSCCERKCVKKTQR